MKKNSMSRSFRKMHFSYYSTVRAMSIDTSCIFRLNLPVFYVISALKEVYCLYNSSNKYFEWFPSPSLMACSLLVRDTMEFIRNFICPNHVPNIISQKSLLLFIFRPYNFAPFDPVFLLSKLLQLFRSYRTF